MKIKTIKYSDIMKHPHLSLNPKDYCDRCNQAFLEDDDQIETFDDELLCSPCFIKKEKEE